MKIQSIFCFSILCCMLTFGQTKHLQKDSLLVDIQYLEKVIKEVHPGVYRYNSEADINTLFNELRASISDNMTENQWVLALAQSVKKIKCGHTYVNPWNMKKDIRNRLFGGDIYIPLGFDVINNQMVVTENLSNETSIQRGDLILSINGNKTATILDSLKTISKQDGNNLSPINQYLSLNEFGVKRWEFFDMYYPLFFGLQDNFEIEYESYGTKAVKKVTLPALSKKARQDRFTKPIDTKRWSLTREKDYYIMKLGTFATWNWKGFDHKKWFSDAFKKINSSDTRALVIDIRGNEGGSGAIGDELLSYLIPETSPCNPDQKILTRTIKVDKALKPYSDTWVKNLFTGFPKEEYNRYNKDFYELKESFDCQPIIPKKNGYKKQVYFLGGASNVSATFQLLKKSKELASAHFIGTESGGNKQGINGGAYIFFYLPYSKMEIDVPIKFFTGGKNQKDEGIQPEFFVDYTQKDIHDNHDPYIELVNELIRNKNKITDRYFTRFIESSQWRGNLTYLDYRSNKKVVIPADLKTVMIDKKTTEIHYLYPDEPHMNSTSKLVIDLSKGKIEDRKITSVQNKDGVLKIVAIKNGKDDNKKVTFRYTYIISQHKFSISKEFKPLKGDEYTLRNIYEFQR